MFLDFYGLREQPFGVTPNPRFLFPSPSHREVLASLLYAIQSDLGFSALIAEPGMGKTTLLFDLLERYRNSANTAFLFQTQCDSQDLLRYLLAEFGVETEGRDSFFMHEKFRDVLLQSARENKKVLLILDEAHNLDDSVLETIRLLSNFETSDSKLVHIILAGQTYLAEKLMRPTMAQLFQRISIINRLKPFTYEETCAYIDHRLEFAGYNRGPLFTRAALEEIARYSHGVPRTINRLCFGGMSIACALNKREIDASIIEEVREDLNLSSFLTPNYNYEIPLRIETKPVEPDPSDSAEGIASPPRYADRQPVPSPPAEPDPAPITPVESDATLERVRNIVSPPRPPGKAALRAEKEKAAARSPAVRLAITTLMVVVFLLLLTGLLLYGKAGLDRILAKSPDAQAVQASSTAAAEPANDTKPPTPVRSRAPTSQKSRSATPAGNSAKSASNRTSTIPVITLPSFADSASISPSPNGNVASPSEKPNPPAPIEDPTPPPVTMAASGENSQAPLAGVMGNVLSSSPKVTVDTEPTRTAEPPRTSGPIVPGKLMEHPQPVYPEDAKKMGIEGTVLLTAVIAKDGKVRNVTAIEGNPRLVSAAENAVRNWKYKPYTLGGEPVEVDTQIRINFNLKSK